MALKFSVETNGMTVGELRALLAAARRAGAEDTAQLDIDGDYLSLEIENPVVPEDELDEEPAYLHFDEFSDGSEFGDDFPAQDAPSQDRFQQIREEFADELYDLRDKFNDFRIRSGLTTPGENLTRSFFDLLTGETPTRGRRRGEHRGTNHSGDFGSFIDDDRTDG